MTNIRPVSDKVARSMCIAYIGVLHGVALIDDDATLARFPDDTAGRRREKVFILERHCIECGKDFVKHCNSPQQRSKIKLCDECR